MITVERVAEALAARVDICGNPALETLARSLRNAGELRGEGERDDQVIERVLTAFEEAVAIAREVTPPLRLENVRA